jgi:hypothetical protein
MTTHKSNTNFSDFHGDVDRTPRWYEDDDVEHLDDDDFSDFMTEREEALQDRVWREGQRG